MAGGDGGFSIKPMGFDKNEVNEYIAKINRNMKELEAEKSANDDKVRAALKKADEADDRIKAAKAEGDKKIAELELELKNERKNSEKLLEQIDELKRSLKSKGASGAGSDKAAQKQAEEIIAKANASAADIVKKANATAKNTVEKAKETAQQLVSSAGGGAGGADPAAVNELLGVIGDFVSKVTSGANDLRSKAGSLLKAEKGGKTAVTVPDFSNIKVPQAEAPAAQTASKPSAKALDDDIFAALEDDDKKAEQTREEDFEPVTEVKPLDDPNKVPRADILDDFDLSETGTIDEFDGPIAEVEPTNGDKPTPADLSIEFEQQILAQTANSSSLRTNMDDEMYASVRQQEEHFAVKPSDDNIADFDMDAPSNAVTTMDDLLRQAELAFGGASASAPADNTADEEETRPASDNSGGDNMWAELQNELWAMEKTGGLGGSDDSGSDGMNVFDDPAAPSADNSDIWNLGLDDMDSSGDDDMSMDIFGM